MLITYEVTIEVQATEEIYPDLVVAECLAQIDLPSYTTCIAVTNGQELHRIGTEPNECPACASENITGSLADGTLSCLNCCAYWVAP